MLDAKQLQQVNGLRIARDDLARRLRVVEDPESANQYDRLQVHLCNDPVQDEFVMGAVQTAVLTNLRSKLAAVDARLFELGVDLTEGD